ncbi:YetF domain-containing protein [Domibacillus indicus]
MGLIDEGEINKGILNDVGKSKKWLYGELEKEGYSNIQDILYTE